MLNNNMFELKESEINGTGIFATEYIAENTIIGTWCTKDRTQGIRFLFNEGMECIWYETEILGRYCNHNISPNTYIQVNSSDLVLISKGILKDEEILTNYNWVKEYIGFNVIIP